MSGYDSPEVEMDTSSTSYTTGGDESPPIGDAASDSPASSSHSSHGRRPKQLTFTQQQYKSCQEGEQLSTLYPYVDHSLLPSHWSTKDKPNFISVSEDGRKVHYKGQGKTHKDAAAVRANQPVPSSCLLYYFEVTILSKGRDGYMGIGLAGTNVSTNRLPGWDKQSYGYHGDDGHSFNSSGTGNPYGPTFTTNDIIGCGYNLVENKCFYTKNGLHIGVAFTDLPKAPLYPTVGLQTLGEELEANFGHKPFAYDIEQDLIALRKRLTGTINSFEVNHAEWQPMLHSLVQGWLVHNGYCSTAQLFADATRIPFNENVQAIKNRYKIQQLVLSGRIGDAITMTNRLYPTVLLEDPNLLFILKCRQFIEFVCGYDQQSLEPTNGNAAALEAQMDVDSQTPCGSSVKSDELVQSSDEEETAAATSTTPHGSPIPEESSSQQAVNVEPVAGPSSSVDGAQNGHRPTGNDHNYSPDKRRNTEALIAFGKELNSFSKQLKEDFGHSEDNKLMLEEAFHFVAFPNPLESILHSTLVYLDRENVCQQLNNAIVAVGSGEGGGRKVAIETAIKHTKALVELNNHAGAWLLNKL